MHLHVWFYVQTLQLHFVQQGQEKSQALCQQRFAFGFRKSFAYSTLCKILTMAATVEIPKFVPCSHGKFYACDCLDLDLKTRYVYKHHKHGIHSCLKRDEKLGHLDFTQSGYYLVERPVWKDDCNCNYNIEHQEQLVKIINLLGLNCECTSTFDCSLCNGFWTNDAKGYKRCIYIHRDLQLDVTTCLILFPFIQFPTVDIEWRPKNRLLFASTLKFTTAIAFLTIKSSRVYTIFMTPKGVCLKNTSNLKRAVLF